LLDEANDTGESVLITTRGKPGGGLVISPESSLRERPEGILGCLRGSRQLHQ
jgi:hypothetical protein